MTQSLNSAPQKQKFSVAINSKMYQNLIASTLRDPARASIPADAQEVPSAEPEAPAPAAEAEPETVDIGTL